MRASSKRILSTLIAMSLLIVSIYIYRNAIRGAYEDIQKKEEK
jgi:hypothetical protein